MLTWNKIDTKHYESEDGRFVIEKTWNAKDGIHWSLRDRTEKGTAQTIRCQSINHAKETAEQKMLVS